MLIAARLEIDAMMFTLPTKPAISTAAFGTLVPPLYKAMCCDARIGTRIALTNKSAKARDARRKLETTWSDFFLNTTMIVRELPKVPSTHKAISTQAARRTAVEPS